MIEGLASIAVFTENRTLWDHAIAMWNIRVPAYIYISDDGPTHKPGPARCGKYSPYWYDQVVFNASVRFTHTTPRPPARSCDPSDP
jgi:hypothetical protein